MDSTGDASFPRFKHLPPELRQYIWHAALSEWSVWSPSHKHSLVDLKPYLTLVTLGHCAPAAGQACRESRQLMERICTKVVSDKPQDDTGHAPSYWLHPQRTILYLGCTERATNFIEVIHAHERLAVDHVVLRVCEDWVQVSRLVYVLARYCPGIRTLMLHLAADRREPHQYCWCDNYEPSGDLADLYKAILSHQSGERLPYEESAEGARFRLALAEFFGDSEGETAENGEDGGKGAESSSSPPVLHFLPPDAVLLPSA